MLKRYLTEEAGIEEFNIKHLFRVAARIGLIDDIGNELTLNFKLSSKKIARNCN